MTGFIRKVQSGTPQKILAREWNAIADMVNEGRREATGSPPAAESFGSVGTVLVQNLTGSGLSSLRPVVGLGDPVNAPVAREAVVFEMPAFQGEVPDEDLHTGKFAVLAGPVGEDGIQSGITSGVTWVRVDFENSDDEYADIDDGSTARLKSGSSGAAKVLWKESGTGELWAVVRLGNPGSGRLAVLGPCVAYTPAAELPDTDFGITYPDGCDGPSRWGLSLIRPGDSAVVNVELMPGGGPLEFWSDVFAHSCGTFSIDVFAVAKFTDMDQYGVTIQLFEDGANPDIDPPVATFINSIFAFNHSIGGYLQYQTGSCPCGTIASEACLSRPER